MATYPTSVKTFTSKSDGAGNTISASHINDLQDEVTAIEDGLLNGTAPLTSSRATVASLSVLGGSTISSNVVIGGSLSVASSATVTASLDVGGQFALSGALVFGGIQTSTFSGGNTDNLAVGSSVFYLRLSPSSNSTLTGLDSGSGNRKMFLIQNVGTANMHLPHNTGSVSSNRFLVAGSVGSTLVPGGAVFCIGDATAWRLVTL